MIEWNNFDPKIQISKSISIPKKSILTFIRSVANGIFNCHNPRGLKLLSRFRLG